MPWRMISAAMAPTPEQLLLPREKRRTDRPWNLEIPPTLIDAVQAVLLSMPRPKERRGPRSRWTIESVETMVKRGLTLNAAARAEAARTGASAETIARGDASQARSERRSGAKRHSIHRGENFP